MTLFLKKSHLKMNECIVIVFRVGDDVFVCPFVWFFFCLFFSKKGLGVQNKTCLHLH